MEQAGRPSAAGYWVALVLVIGGIAGGVAMMAKGCSGMMRAMENLPSPLKLPASHEVELKAGDYAVLEETSQARPPANWAQLWNLQIVEKATGQTVAIKPSSGTTTYTVNDRAFESLYTFEASSDGTYVVSASVPQDPTAAPDARDGEQSAYVVLVAQSTVAKPLATFGGGCAVMAACGLAALIIFIVTIVKRSSARRARPPQQFPGM